MHKWELGKASCNFFYDLKYQVTSFLLRCAGITVCIKVLRTAIGVTRFVSKRVIAQEAVVSVATIPANGNDEAACETVISLTTVVVAIISTVAAALTIGTSFSSFSLAVFWAFHITRSVKNDKATVQAKSAIITIPATVLVEVEEAAFDSTIICAGIKSNCIYAVDALAFATRFVSDRIDTSDTILRYFASLTCHRVEAIDAYTYITTGPEVDRVYAEQTMTGSYDIFIVGTSVTIIILANDITTHGGRASTGVIATIIILTASSTFVRVFFIVIGFIGDNVNWIIFFHNLGIATRQLVTVRISELDGAKVTHYCIL